MKHIEQLRDMLCEELDEMTKKGKLTVDSLDAIDMLTHSIKSIDTILAMEDAGYSNGYSGRRYYYDDGYSRRGSYNNNGSYAGGRGRRRDSNGRYSRGDSRMTDDDYME